MNRRKGAGTPYIAHLLGVASIALEHGGNEDLAIAGLLHDAIEEVGVDREARIAERFGPRVARVVRGHAPTPTRRPSRHGGQQGGRPGCPAGLGFRQAPQRPRDRHRPTGYQAAMFTRFAGGLDGTVWCYAALSDVFTRRLPGSLANDLADTAREMRRLAKNGAVCSGLAASQEF